MKTTAKTLKEDRRYCEYEENLIKFDNVNFIMKEEMWVKAMYLHEEEGGKKEYKVNDISYDLDILQS